MAEPIIGNGTVVRERRTAWHDENKREPQKGVVISQTDEVDRVVVRWEGNGEWTESTYRLVPLDEKPVQDGTRAYS